jgi:omega-6 fatty acid desaturase (delta-12 desaturase)
MLLRTHLTWSRAHCFHRSALRSSLYVLQDFAMIAALVYAAYQIDPFLAKL